MSNSRKRVGRRQCLDAGAGQPGPSSLVESAGHVAGLVPQTPAQRDRRKAVSTAVRGQPIQERVRRRIVGLTRGPHQPRHRRKHHKRRHTQITRQLMQIPGRIHLGPQHRIHPIRRQRRHHRIIEHPRSMNHRRQRMLHRNIRQNLGQRLTISRITGHHRHLRTSCRQLRANAAAPGASGPRRLTNNNWRTP